MKCLVPIVVGLALAGLVLSAAAAGNYDGSKPLLCSTIVAVECGLDGECVRGSAELIDAPQFFRIDFDAKEVHTSKRAEEGKVSRFHSLQALDDRLVLQGIDNGLGWSMVISADDGKMDVSAAGDEVGFLLFGACTVL